jgi:hypothetical protein
MFFDRGSDSETRGTRRCGFTHSDRNERWLRCGLCSARYCAKGRICLSTDPRRYCTVSVVKPEIPSRLAEMFAVPFPVENAIPLRVTMATAGFDVVHCTYGVAI